ncbi:MAG: hypothetical protein ACETWG_04830 [Candidatus Neomarinimicrobiota bacterium]
MNHLDNDLLLKYVLQLLDDRDATHVRTHLDACPECSTRLAELEADTRLLGALEPRIEPSFPPLAASKPASVPAVLKLAAAFVCGCLLGFFVSEWRNPGSVQIVEQHLVPQSPPAQISQFYPTEQLELAIELE